MNHRFFLVAMLASLASVSSAQVSDLPGGITAKTSSGKYIVHYDWRSGQKTILLDEPFSEWGVDRVGNIVFVAGESRYVSGGNTEQQTVAGVFRGKNPGKPSWPINNCIKQTVESMTKKSSKAIFVDRPAPSELKNIRVSQDGKKCSYEYNGIIFGFPTKGVLWGMVMGNKRPVITISTTWFPASSHLTDLLVQDKVARYLVDRSAYGGAWTCGSSNSSYAQGKNLFAGIVACANGIVVEIRDETFGGQWYKGGTIRKDEKPGVYEAWLPVELMANADLSWSPNGAMEGSLYIRSGNQIFSVMTVSEIENKIALSGVTKNPDKRCYGPVPVNWTWTAQPTLVETKDVSGNPCKIDGAIQWVNDTTFVFRNGSGTLSVCRNGVVEETGMTIPEVWFWCDPPTASGQLATVAQN